MSWTKSLPYFSESELMCKGSGIILLDDRFAVELPKLRKEWGRPMSPSSVCRSPRHNQNEGGHPRSLHLTQNPKWETFGTMAADIRWYGWNKDTRLEFAKLAWSMGWSIGLNNAFCHIDRRGEVPGMAQSVFTYGSNWNNEFTKDDIA